MNSYEHQEISTFIPKGTILFIDESSTPAVIEIVRELWLDGSLRINIFYVLSAILGTNFFSRGSEDISGENRLHQTVIQTKEATTLLNIWWKVSRL